MPYRSMLLALSLIPISEAGPAGDGVDAPLAAQAQDANPLFTLQGGMGGGARGKVVFSPDSRLLAFTGDRGTIKLWEVATGKPVASYPAHDGAVFGLAFSPDGKRLALGCGEKVVKVVDALTGANAETFPGHEGSVWSVAFSPDGSRLASGGSDRIARVWDLRSGRETLALRGHTNSVCAVAFSLDGARLATGGFDSVIRVWDATTGRELRAMKKDGPAMAVAFKPDGGELAAAGFSSLGFWDTRSGKQRMRVDTSYSDGLAFTRDGRHIATSVAVPRGDDDQAGRRVVLYDASLGKEVLSLDRDFTPRRGVWYEVCDVAISPDGARLATASKDCKVKVWDLSRLHDQK